MPYKLLVFDWDGTIIDSASTIADCIREASRQLGLPVPAPEQARHVIGLGLQDALIGAVPDLPPERYPEFVAAYRQHFTVRKDAMQLFAGMRDLLDELCKRHVLAIATGKSRRGLDRDLDVQNLKPYFTASRCADETNPKPHPAMLLELLEELMIEPASALMIGDTSHDLEMARAAGVDALAVSYGAHPEAGLQACAPLHCVADVQSLATWLKKNA